MQYGTFFELIHPAAPPLFEVALLHNVAYLSLWGEENFKAISEPTVCEYEILPNPLFYCCTDMQDNMWGAS